MSFPESPSSPDSEELGLELDGASEEELSGIGAGNPITKAFTKANILEKLMKSLMPRQTPHFLLIARSNPSYGARMFSTALHLPGKFPCLSKKLGIVLGPQVGMTASPA